jgi:hypothetical protein
MPTHSTTSRAHDIPADGRSDFNFFFGNWDVSHRRLQRRLAGDTNWDVFGGTCEVRPLLGGLGNVDDNVIELPDGAYRAATVRTFDPATRQWSIWWIDGRIPLTIDVPVRGAFVDGVGTSSTAGRSRFVSSGRRSRKTRRAGSRPFRRMAARPGRPTGSWSLPAGHEPATGAYQAVGSSLPGMKASKAASNCSR